MGRLVLIVAGLALVAIQPAFAAGAPCAEGDITVTGTVRNLGTVQEEPSAAPQTNFILEHPSCGDSNILVGGAAPIFCGEGDLAIVQGRYMPPSRLIGVPIIDGAKVECRSSDSRQPGLR